MQQYFICLLGMLIFLACHKDSDEIITIIENPDPPTILITTRLVSVLDEKPIEISPFHLTFAGQSEVFDDFDFQQIRNSGISRDYELIQLTTEPNLQFYKVSSLIENDVNYTHLKIPEITIYDGATTVDGSFPISIDENLNIPIDNLLNSDGSIYQGAYKVYLSKIDPAAMDAPYIPSFTGITPNNKEAGLLFESCYYVCVLSTENEQLTFGTEAHITIPTIPMTQWTFDPLHAVWVQIINNISIDHEKIQLKSGGYYATAEAHNMTRVKGTLKINGSPSPHYPITITYGGQRRVVHTTNSGSWAIQLPSEIMYQATIAFPCGETIQLLLETNTASEMVTNLDVTNTQIENVRLVGIARDCGFNPLLNHYSIVDADVSTILFNAQPDINFNIPVCKQGTFTISSINPADGQSGPEVSWEAADTVDIHSSLACELASNEYLSLVVSGDTKIYWSLQSRLEGGRLLIKDDGTEPDLEFQVFIEGLSEGKYADNMLNILFEDMNLGNRGYSLYCPTATSGCGFTDFTITHFPQETGQWIRGHFEGSFWIKTFNPLTAGYRPVKGEFQVYREF